MSSSVQRMKLYDKYRDKDLTFNSDVIRATGLKAGKVVFRCRGKDYPCLLYSCNMTGARVIAPLPPPVFEELKKAENKIALRLVFLDQEKRHEISLFINTEAVNFNLYKSSGQNNYFMTLLYKTIPPEDYIDILGHFWEHENNDEKRIHDRISINEITRQSLGLQPLESFLFVDGNAKKCVLSEISIMSAKVIISGTHDEFKNKKGLLIIKSDTLEGKGEMVGKIIRSEEISNNHKLLSLIILFDQEAIPPQYKMWIGECLESLARSRMKK